MPERPLTLLERTEHRFARWLAGLPPSVQLKLCGDKPVCLDGLTLHPEMQVILALRRLRGTAPFSTLSPGRVRRQLVREALTHAGEQIPVGAVRDWKIDGGAGAPLPARHYVPEGASEGQPLLVFFHGGGFVMGDLDTHDPLCRLICREAQVQVLSVEYRKGPEHPFPTAVEDAVAAFRWAHAHAEQLGADPRRIGVGGDSAGGNLAAVVSQITTREGGSRPTTQLLIYPVVDRTVSRPSLELFADGFFLTKDDIEWFSENYTGIVDADVSDPRVSPLLAKDLSGLPPALVITAGFDPLRDEGEAYAAALRDAGTPTVFRRFDQMIHGFVNMTGLSAAARSGVVEIARALRPLLHATSSEARPTRTGSDR